MPCNTTRCPETACNATCVSFIEATCLFLSLLGAGKLLHIYLLGTPIESLGTGRNMVSTAPQWPCESFTNVRASPAVRGQRPVVIGEAEEGMRVQLTDRFCANAKSKGVQTDYFDATVPGLALRVTSNGTKAWSLLHGSPRRRVTLGRYPSLSLAAARTRAIEVKDGRSSGTIAALAETYLRSIGGLRSVREIDRRLRRDVIPVIGHIPLSELHRRDVTRVIDGKIVDAPITARRVFEDIRAMVRWAVARGDLDHNPLDGMKGPAISKPRTRVLSDSEIRSVWTGLRPDVSRVIRFCLVTAQRVGEVTGLCPSELDLASKVWVIPASRSKNGYAHQVPLSSLALKLIAEIDGQFGVSKNVVADIVWRHQQRANGHERANGDGERWTAHDLRRSALTRMAGLGVEPIVLGHVANHRTTTKAGTTLGVYIQHAYEVEKRKALELWADRLLEIISGG
jgi:integrase